MKYIIYKHNESSWEALERSHAEGVGKKDETSLSHRHHKNFSFIHSYIWTNLLSYHDTLVWTLASFLTISTNHDKVKEKKYSLHIRTEMICVRCKIIILFFASSSLLLYVCCKHTQMRTNRKCKRYGKQSNVGLYYFTFIR